MTTDGSHQVGQRLWNYDDSLRAPSSRHFQLVLTTPPFGRKSNIRFVNDQGEQESESLVVIREDFWASTSNKQLNFLQHVYTMLETNGRTAIVVPDNVLSKAAPARPSADACSSSVVARTDSAARPSMLHSRPRL